MVAGVGIERRDVAIGVFHAHRAPMGATPRSIVLEVGNDGTEDVIPELGRRVVVVDHGAIDSFLLSGLFLRQEILCGLHACPAH